MRVPLVLFLTAVALSGAGLWLWAACGPKNAPPPELYYDFGVIRHGLAKDHVFEVPMPQTVGGEEIIPVTFCGDCACASGTIMIQDTAGNRRLVASRAPKQPFLKIRVLIRVWRGILRASMTPAKPSQLHSETHPRWRRRPPWRESPSARLGCFFGDSRHEHRNRYAPQAAG